MNGRRLFTDTLSSHESGSLSDEAIKKLDVLFKKQTLNLDYISRKSSAFAKLCEYVRNMLEYEKLLKAKKPKDKVLKNTHIALEKAQNKLKSINEKIQKLEIETNIVIQKFNEANERKISAQNDADKTLNYINLANRLIAGLMSENSLWDQKLELLNEQKINIATDYLLAAHFITYAGPFTKKYRKELVNNTLNSYSNIIKV